MILVHNRLFGDRTPSRSDINMTKQIIKAGHSLNVEIHDHLIVGRKSVTSFEQQGLM